MGSRPGALRSCAQEVSTARLEALLRDALELRFFELEKAYVMGHQDGIFEILELEQAQQDRPQLLVRWDRAVPASPH